MHKCWIAPSVLAADFTRLGEEALRMEKAGADRLHVDIMDGHFVPNLSFGTCVVEALARSTRLPLDVHLMVENPDAYVEPMKKAGGSSITMHIETLTHPVRSLHAVREAGCQVGITLNPETPVEAIEDVLNFVDLVLVMTVSPGFGGQAYKPETLPKIEAIRARLNACNPKARIAVDGGVNADNAHHFMRYGADTLVSGTRLFQAKDPAEAIRRMREA